MAANNNRVAYSKYMEVLDNLSSNQVAYSLYMDDLNNSEGFYITHSENSAFIFGGIWPVGENYGERFHGKAEVAARHAVEEHNRDNLGKGLPRLEFRKIVNLNVQPIAGCMYYITMAASGEDSVENPGETLHYQIKIRETMNTGFRIQIFRPAPYSMKSSDKLGSNVCCVGIDNLMPWMNEPYLYYNCFYWFRSRLLGLEVGHSEESGKSKGTVWFKNGQDKEDFLNKYGGKRMPCTNLTYSFET